MRKFQDQIRILPLLSFLDSGEYDRVELPSVSLIPRANAGPPQLDHCYYSESRACRDLIFGNPRNIVFTVSSRF
jgi:hypothetical protein